MSQQRRKLFVLKGKSACARYLSTSGSDGKQDGKRRGGRGGKLEYGKSRKGREK